MRNKCSKCEHFKDIIGNYVQCVKTGRLIDWEYWHDVQPEDCPFTANNDEVKEVDHTSKISDMLN